MGNVSKGAKLRRKEARCELKEEVVSQFTGRVLKGC